MALGAQQRPPGRSLRLPPQARIYRRLPSAAEASRGEPSPSRSRARPPAPASGAPARPLCAGRSYCILCPRRALCKRWKLPATAPPRLLGSQKQAPPPPGQCATSWTKRVLKPRRARPRLREGKFWQSLAAEW